MRLAAMTVALLLSTLANSAPAANPGKGRMLVNETDADEMAFLIDGASAQELYGHLDKSLEEKPAPLRQTFAKHGQDISCWKQEADPVTSRPDAFSCGFNLDTDGVVRPYQITAVPGVIGGGFLGEGPVWAMPASPGEVSIAIQGDAARAIYQKLDSSLEQKPTPPLTSFKKKTRHLSCKRWPASSTRPVKYSCGVNFDDQGRAKPFLVKAISGFGGGGN